MHSSCWIQEVLQSGLFNQVLPYFLFDSCLENSFYKKRFINHSQNYLIHHKKELYKCQMLKTKIFMHFKIIIHWQLIHFTSTHQCNLKELNFYSYTDLPIIMFFFQQVPVLLSEFWTCLPVRMFPLLNQPEFLMIVEQCDQALYFVFNDILVPKIPDFLNKRQSQIYPLILFSSPV